MFPQICRRTVLAAIAAGVVTAGVIAAGVTSAVEPQSSRVDYSPDHPSLQADISLPGGPVPATGFPVVIIVHGGGWVGGDKWTMGAFARRLNAVGIASVAIDYRFAPQNPFPDQIDDTREAMLWIVDHAATNHLDVDRIGLWGYSAGAQMSLVVATVANEPLATQLHTSCWPADDKRWDQLPEITAVVGGGSPCEFRTMPPANGSLAFFLGGTRSEFPQRYAAASPAEHVDAGDPPILLIHGSDDLIVPIQSAKTMKAAAVAGAASCRLLEMNGFGHITTFLSAEAQTAAVEFLSEQLRPTAISGGAE